MVKHISCFHFIVMFRFVVSAASDWSLELATYPMSIILAAGGISAAMVGKWQLKVQITVLLIVQIF